MINFNILWSFLKLMYIKGHHYSGKWDNSFLKIHCLTNDNSCIVSGICFRVFGTLNIVLNLYNLAVFHLLQFLNS